MLPEYFIRILYPLGLVANLFFGAAFGLQWILNERRTKHSVSKMFWVFSSFGAMLMIIHGVVQAQLPVALLHTANLVIYFRNLNITSSGALSFKSTVVLMVGMLFLTITPFIVGAYYYSEMQWFAAPNFFHLQVAPVGQYWHVLGCIGLFIFSLRFFSQWFYLEFYGVSDLPIIFWQISLLGGGLAFTYFLRVGDLVNIISYGCGLFPSLANIFLYYRKSSVEQMTNSCFISAGEMSGDVLGSYLVRTIQQTYPNAEWFGVPGPKMRQEGVHPIFNMEEFQVSGFLEIVKALFRLWSKYRSLYKEILKKNPQTVICIDFPDFHFLLIKKLRKRGYKGKIIHYVCPSIWAWRAKRKIFLERYLDVLFLIFPFEKALFKESSLHTVYLGHPLVDQIQSHSHRITWKEELSIDEKPIVAAFPGSRYGDIERNLRVHIRAFLQSSFAHTHQLCVSIADEKIQEKVLLLLQEEGCLQGTVVPAAFRYELMRDCECALAKCGTIVLEGALNYTPMIVTCQLRTFDVFLFKYIFKIFLPSYSLPNIIMGSVIFPEFIGGKYDFSSQDVAAALNILAKPEERYQQKASCQQLYQVMQEGVVKLEDVISSGILFQSQAKVLQSGAVIL